MEKEIKFIARHYRKGLFDREKALRRIGIRHNRWWTPIKVAAASVAFVVLGATAAIIVHKEYSAPAPQAIETTNTPTVAPMAEVKVIDFENATLPVVVSRIKEVYGVEVVNLPENADDYKLSMHYEGTAADLVDTINETLGTDIKVQ